MANTVKWHGASGQEYICICYEAHNGIDRDTSWNDVPGNYIFACFDGGYWKPLYVGETSSFRDRLTSSHERWECAEQYKVTHIHAHTNTAGSNARIKEEEDLINNYKPICNRR